LHSSAFFLPFLSWGCRGSGVSLSARRIGSTAWWCGCRPGATGTSLSASP
jgi:hypothetical protein